MMNDIKEMDTNLTERIKVGSLQNESVWSGPLCLSDEKTENFHPCKLEFDQINLYIIIGVESLLLCVFIATTFYLYLNRTKDINIKQIESSTGVTEEGAQYLNPSEPQLMHYETVINASRRSSINSENPYEIIVNNRSADVSNNNVLSRSYENITEEEGGNRKKEMPPVYIIDHKKLESIPVIIDGCSEIF